MNRPLTRRGLLKGSVLFVAGAAVSACSTGDPLAKGGAAPSGGAAKITLTHWYHEYGEEGTQQAAMKYAADFTKANPDIAVKVSWIPGDYATKWTAAVLTPDGPDVYEVNDVSPNMVKAGQVTALDDVLGAEKADFNPKVLQPYTWGGQVYAVPMIVDPMLVFYRKSLFAKAGVSVPTSFAEFAAAAKKLTQGKQKGLFVGNDGVGPLGQMVPWSNGNLLIDDRDITYDDPKVVEALTAVKDLYDAKATLQGYSTDWWDPGALINGAAAMQWVGLWAVPGLIEALGDDFDAFALPPFGPGGQAVVNMGGWVQVVNGKSRNLEAAKKYVRWLWVENTAAQTDWSLAYGFHIPPRNSAAAQASKLNTGPAKTVMDAVAAHGIKQPALWTAEVRQPYTDAVTAIVKKGADAEKTLADAAKRSQDILDKVPVL
ncbi:ABC transporter substrate-binding protein [Nonomuraea rubra]|uniref:Multiple sugar transport system substrate-binding protein n=2 Tax=Nonomuraea rubra TaxID=46180 RepID=A0A7X0U0H8_9ACTN|nr:extracellular solute-binding protein [Nonomuraea rubra]MBB6550573.1 multiple sugar transport system substrate-binding protein [Nonomuraea rubra]